LSYTLLDPDPRLDSWPYAPDEEGWVPRKAFSGLPPITREEFRGIGFENANPDWRGKPSPKK
jgi:hypothetical protein